MKTIEIPLGFEIDNGKPVDVPLSHLIVTGITQLSGKTTTLEALITRSERRAIVFKTKPGEKGFNSGIPCAPYFKEKSDWQYVSSLLESTLKEKLKFERSWIMAACKGTNSLMEVKRNIQERLADPKLRDLHRSVYTTLDEYLNLILPQMSVISFSKVLDLQPAINIMNLERLSDELQSLVIRSVLDTTLKEMHDVIVVMPEAWKFLPQGRGNPCKQAAEEFIRQGATNRNFLWIDSQDVTGIDKTPIKQVSTWILGIQQEINEVKRTLDQMPISKRLRPQPEEIMSLRLGHFFVCTPQYSKKVYVRPVWMQDEQAKQIARGEIAVDQVDKPLSATLPAVPKWEAPPVPTLPAGQDWGKQIAQLRQEFLGKLQELTTYLGTVMSGIQNIPLQHQPAPVDTDAIVVEVMAKLPNFELMKQQMTDELVKKIPQGGGSGTYTVAPVEGLKKVFLQEEKARMLEKIGKLDPDQKKLLKFVEAGGKGLTQNEICERCFGIKNAGQSFMKVKATRTQLKELGFVRFDDKGKTYPLLKQLLSQSLQFHGATEEEIEQVYNHILAELL